MNCRMSVRNGRIKFYPASLEYIEPVLRSLDQQVKYESIRPTASFKPLFQQTKRIRVGITCERAQSMSLEQLWQVHDTGLYYSSGITLLDLKILILEKLYLVCCLCGHNCQINRYKTKGKCGLGLETFYENQNSLVGEEAIINPTAGIALFGCEWNCSFCHASDYLNVEKGKHEGALLSSSIWSQINYKRCNTIMFSSAGNPTPHVINILKVLRGAPDNMNLPMVWNSNSYGTKLLWKIVNGLVDCYVIDLKFSNDNCAQYLSGCKNHNSYTLETFNSLIKSAGRKIIRWLLLPGHLECCGKNIMNMLSKYDFYVSLVDGFSPSNKMKPNRLNTDAEKQRAKDMIEAHHLKDINNPIHSNTFWK